MTGYLKRHETVHTNQPYICDTCGKTFTTARSRNSHKTFHRYERYNCNNVSAVDKRYSCTENTHECRSCEPDVISPTHTSRLTGERHGTTIPGGGVSHTKCDSYNTGGSVYPEQPTRSTTANTIRFTEGQQHDDSISRVGASLTNYKLYNGCAFADQFTPASTLGGSGNVNAHRKKYTSTSHEETRSKYYRKFPRHHTCSGCGKIFKNVMVLKNHESIHKRLSLRKQYDDCIRGDTATSTNGEQITNPVCTEQTTPTSRRSGGDNNTAVQEQRRHSPMQLLDAVDNDSTRTEKSHVNSNRTVHQIFQTRRGRGPGENQGGRRRPTVRQLLKTRRELGADGKQHDDSIPGDVTYG